MPPRYPVYGYNIADEGRIRILYSRAVALHTVREHLSELYEWSEPDTNHIGTRFKTICAEVDVASAKATTNRAAALKLRRTLLKQLKSADLVEPDHVALRDRVVQTLADAADAVADPFGPIFGYVSDQASAWFGERWPGVDFVIEGATGRYYHPDSPLFVNAYTDLHIGVPDATPTVHLGIWIERLNLDTYAAIFAVLVHELVCHVPAPRGQSPNPGDDPNKSVFAEGFADWAAMQLFERWLYNIDPLLHSAAKEFGLKISKLSMDRDGGNRYWQSRHLGHRAAERAVAIFRQAGQPPTDAENSTITLARELTTLDARLVLKDIFVRNLSAVDAEMADRLQRWSLDDCPVSELLLPN